MTNEAAILDSLRSAIACVAGGLVDEALRYVDSAKLGLDRAKLARGITRSDDRVMAGLDELRDATPIVPRARVLEWDELGGEG